MGVWAWHLWLAFRVRVRSASISWQNRDGMCLRTPAAGWHAASLLQYALLAEHYAHSTHEDIRTRILAPMNPLKLRMPSDPLFDRLSRSGIEFPHRLWSLRRAESARCLQGSIRRLLALVLITSHANCSPSCKFMSFHRDRIARSSVISNTIP